MPKHSFMERNGMSWGGFNRRHFPRIIYPCLVKCSCGEGKTDLFLTHTENIGEGGLCFITKKEVRLFTPVDLEVDLLDAEDHLYVKGKVAWSVGRKAIESIKPSFYDIGVEFIEISHQAKERLKNVIARLMKHGSKILE
jgi:Tfp pilus assembly protein PilZ